jgi:hypothetical protein
MLRLGFASAATLTLVGGGLAVLRAPAWRNNRLTEVGRRILGAIARAVLDGTLPAVADPQLAAVESHLERMEVTLAALPPAMQIEVNDLLVLLDSAPGRLVMTGLMTDWHLAGVAQVQSALQSMRTSRIDLRQQAYHALRDLTHAAYFASTATWTQLGYPGPTRLA